MHKRKVEFFVIDVLISLDRINRYLKQFKTPQEFLSNEEYFDATIRELEILGEAMKHILKNQKFNKLAQNHWRAIVNFRNVISHEYFGIDLGIITAILYTHLPVFIEEFLDFVNKIENKNILIQAIEDSKKDLKNLNRQASINFLNKFQKKLN